MVVLGDIGRSPRMQYHALSLARQVCIRIFVVYYYYVQIEAFLYFPFSVDWIGTILR